jgi:hypothetical protein
MPGVAEQQLVILGGPRDREIVTIDRDRWDWQMMEVGPLTRHGLLAEAPVRVEHYQVRQVAPGEAFALPAGVTTWKVLTPARLSAAELDELLARDKRPVVTGPNVAAAVAHHYECERCR